MFSAERRDGPWRWRDSEMNLQICGLGSYHLLFRYSYRAQSQYQRKSFQRLIVRQSQFLKAYFPWVVSLDDC